jgi:GntR family transcriptional regulator of arabinose operon
MNKVTDISISHGSFVSLHVQLHNALRQLILSGRWPPGSRMPSESQLCNHLQISRSTVRLALQNAEVEGLIERIPGRGTFVADTTIPQQRFIAFVTSRFDHQSDQLLLSGAENMAKATGYRVIFCNTDDIHEEVNLLQNLADENIAGVLLWPSSSSSPLYGPVIQYYQQKKIPVVFMDRLIDEVDYDCVTSDNYQGTCALMDHLIELGHQNIVFLSHRNMNLLPVKERYRGYRETMETAGLCPQAPWLIGHSDREISAEEAFAAFQNSDDRLVRQIMTLLSAASDCPTAIFAVNDHVALITLGVMKHLKLHVPDDISIVGFDDTDISIYSAVPLTTIAQDTYTIGMRAAQRLLERIEGDTGPTTYATIPTQLRIRMSTSVPVKKLC